MEIEEPTVDLRKNEKNVHGGFHLAMCTNANVQNEVHQAVHFAKIAQINFWILKSTKHFSK